MNDIDSSNSSIDNFLEKNDSSIESETSAKGTSIEMVDLKKSKPEYQMKEF